MSNLNNIYSERKWGYYFLLLPHTTHAQREMFWENYFNIDILLAIESLLLRQDSEHSSTLLGLEGEGRLMFNSAVCFVNWENGNANQDQEMLLLVIERGAGLPSLLCGNGREQAMLRELSNPGPAPGAAWGVQFSDLLLTYSGQRGKETSEVLLWQQWSRTHWTAGFLRWPVRKGRRGLKHLFS